ncbi:MAG: hypothetical protein IT377_17275 [Polyangiaceae bacterium]|nr:hypothetical protein [Polyangiaceae bacterium]
MSSAEQSLAVNSGVNVGLGDVGAGPLSAAFPASISTLEKPAWLAEKLANQAASPVRAPALSAKASVLEALAAKSPLEAVSVTVTLEGNEVDWDLFKKVADDDSARLAFINQRRTDLVAAQKPLVDWLLARGASAVESFWSTNQLSATIPAGLAPELATQKGVTELSLPTTFVEGVSYSGSQSKNGTLLTDFYAVSIDGRAGSRSGGGDIRIGIYEPASIVNRDHVGWRDWAGGPSRIQIVRDCTQTSCPSTSATTTNNHGTLVTWAAAGSIEQGQDSAYPGTDTVAQRERSGHLKEAAIYFYKGGDNLSYKRAINQAVADGVDVFNHSGGGDAPTICNPSANPDGVNQTLQAAVSAGMVVTACGGNSGSTSCKAWWPGFRTETLGVNGLDSYDATWDYGYLGMLSDASRGGVPILVGGTYASTTYGIDLVAPGRLTSWFSHTGSTGYASTEPAAAGCSVASPVVAGAVGALRNSFQAVGWPTQYAEGLMVNMLALGDGWDADTGQKRNVYMSNLSGAGRIRMHWPSAQNLTSPWGWGWRSFTIHQGETVKWPVWDSGPESSAVQQWKWAAFWMESDLNNVADIDFQVVNTCPPGGGTTPVRGDASRSLRSHFMLLQSEISGRCLEMQAYGYYVPPEGRVVWSADYFHSGYTWHH